MEKFEELSWESAKRCALAIAEAPAWLAFFAL